MVCDIRHRVAEDLRLGNLGGLRKGSIQKRGGIATLDKKLSFPSFWIESLHLHCKGGEDEETERKEWTAGVVRMRRGVEKIAMGVSRFVEYRSDKSIAIDRYQNA